MIHIYIYIYIHVYIHVYIYIMAFQAVVKGSGLLFYIPLGST